VESCAASTELFIEPTQDSSLIWQTVRELGDEVSFGLRDIPLIAAFTHTMVNAISHGKSSRSASHLGP